MHPLWVTMATSALNIPELLEEQARTMTKSLPRDRMQSRIFDGENLMYLRQRFDRPPIQERVPPRWITMANSTPYGPPFQEERNKMLPTGNPGRAIDREHLVYVKERFDARLPQEKIPPKWVVMATMSTAGVPDFQEERNKPSRKNSVKKDRKGRGLDEGNLIYMKERFDAPVPLERVEPRWIAMARETISRRPEFRDDMSVVSARRYMPAKISGAEFFSISDADNGRNSVESAPAAVGPTFIYSPEVKPPAAKRPSYRRSFSSKIKNWKSSAADFFPDRRSAPARMPPGDGDLFSPKAKKDRRNSFYSYVDASLAPPTFIYSPEPLKRRN